MMLEQAGLRPGLRVLEIGSGGYNAALIAEIVGEDGEVTTIDIDPDVISRTHVCLTEAQICGFVSMQGDGAHQERLLLLRGKEIALRFDDGWPAEPDLLNGALTTAREQAWSSVTVGRMEPFDTLQLWLATALDGFCLLAVDPTLDTGLVAPQNRMACPAMVDGGSFAHLALRKLNETTFEFGAHAFGPDAAEIADTVVEQIRVWDRLHRRGPGPRIAAHPADTPDQRLPDGLVITKRHVCVAVSWPAGTVRTAG
jgi:protein-L-isoaspartate(D-aspartate) O-methyltransferase